MRYLTKVTETYRLASEKEVEEFLKELKADNRFTVAKYTSTKKEKKSKGEVTFVKYLIVISLNQINF